MSMQEKFALLHKTQKRASINSEIAYIRYMKARQIIALYLLSLIGQSQTITIPQLNDNQHINLIFDQEAQFPELIRETLVNSPNDTFEDQRALMEELANNEEYNKLMKERADLLTIRIFNEQDIGYVTREVIDGDFIQQWGQSLAGALDNDEVLNTRGHSDTVTSGLLSEIKGILESPEGRVNSNALANNLINTIGNISPELRRQINQELQNGKVTLLKQHLPNSLEGTRFNPAQLGLEVGRPTDYYLSIIEKSFEAGKKLDQLLPLYIFSKNVPDNLKFGRYLERIGEAELDIIKDAHNKRSSISEILDALPGQNRRSLRGGLERRLEKVGKMISSQKKTITSFVSAADTQLTLTEVHPHVGVFRGNLGDDCATTHSFGYANSPLERVFFISNKEGKAVGYVNGTMVNLSNGKKAFFINTISGPRVSGTMTEAIFSGFTKSQEALGVDDIVILGKNNLSKNINFSIIREGYENSWGNPVTLTFRDEGVRNIIAKHVDSSSYDSATRNKNAYYLKDPEVGVAVEVERRPFQNFEISDLSRTISIRNQLRTLSLSPELAKTLGLHPDLTDIIGRQNFINFLSNEDNLDTHSYEQKITEILKKFGIERESIEQTYDLLGGNYYIGRMNAADAFSVHRMSDTARIFNSLPIEKRAQYFRPYRDSYAQIPSSLQEKIFTPLKIAERTVAKMEIDDFKDTPLMNIFDLFPSSESSNRALYEKLRLRVGEIMEDAGFDLSERLDLLKKYKKLASPNDLASVLVRTRDGMEAMISNPNIALQDRLFALGHLKTVFPEIDISPLTGKIYGEIHEIMANPNIEMMAKIHAFDEYRKLATAEQTVLIAERLRESMQVLVTDPTTNVANKTYFIGRYKNIIATEEQFSQVNKIFNEWVMDFVTGPQNEIELKLTNVEQYKRTTLASEENLLQVVKSLGNRVEVAMIDPSIDIDTRLTIAKRYQVLNPEWDFSRILTRLHEGFEYAVLHRPLANQSRLESIYQRLRGNGHGINPHASLRVSDTAERINLAFRYNDLVARSSTNSGIISTVRDHLIRGWRGGDPLTIQDFHDGVETWRNNVMSSLRDPSHSLADGIGLIEQYRELDPQWDLTLPARQIYQKVQERAALLEGAAGITKDYLGLFIRYKEIDPEWKTSKIPAALNDEMREIITKSSVPIGDRIELLEQYRRLSPNGAPSLETLFRERFVKGLQDGQYDTSDIWFKIGKKYRETASKEDFLQVVQVMRKRLETRVQNGTLVSQLLDLFKAYKELAPTEDFLQLMETVPYLAEEIELSNNWQFQLSVAREYKELVPEESYVKVKDELHKKFRNYSFNNHNIWGLARHFEEYQEFASREEIAEALDLLRTELRVLRIDADIFLGNRILERAITDQNLGIENRFLALEKYKEVTPLEDVLQMAEGLHPEVLTAMEDADIDMSVRLGAARIYKEVISEEKYLAVRNALRNEMEHFMQDKDLDIARRIEVAFSFKLMDPEWDSTEALRGQHIFIEEFLAGQSRPNYKSIIIGHYKGFNPPREDLERIAEKVLPNLEKEIFSSAGRMDTKGHYLKIYADLYPNEHPDLEHPGHIKRRLIERNSALNQRSSELERQLKDIPDPPKPKIPIEELYQTIAEDLKEVGWACDV